MMIININQNDVKPLDNKPRKKNTAPDLKRSSLLKLITSSCLSKGLIKLTDTEFSQDSMSKSLKQATKKSRKIDTSKLKEIF